MPKSTLELQRAGQSSLVDCAIAGVDAARVAASHSGRAIVYAKDGVVYEKQPDGHRREIERVEAPRKVRSGWIAKLR